MSVGILLVGFTVSAFQGWPRVEPFAFLGGCLWATGNVMALPAIQLIGMGMGLLLWGASNMCIGWATGTFGLFDLTKDDVAKPELNFAGVALALAALAMYLFVDSSGAEADDGDDYAPLAADEYDAAEDGDAEGAEAAKAKGGSDNSTTPAWMKKIHPSLYKPLGVGFAITAGIFFGTSFDPSQYLIDHCDDCSDDSMDYVISHFLGILLCSLFWFGVAYLASGGGLLVTSDWKFIVPAMISGAMWGVATASWFLANGSLGFSVAFPIITSGPGMVGALWGIFVFGEIKGQRNLLILSGAFAMTLGACVLIGLSR
mmetsp:Transcript_26682/g.83526  ORF Transcript_26682/g.83526 Transcript_26682/m.83526 type:complete len:315 (+) Transcript_26682:485-1429(+)